MKTNNTTYPLSSNCSYDIFDDLSKFVYKKPAVFVFGQNFFAYLTPVILIVGIIGNSLSLAVFTTKHMRKMSASTYLAALSIADICTLVFYVFVEWLRRGLVYLLPEAKLKFLDSNGFCQVLLYLSYVSRTMSTWIIVLFTIERFMGICFPLKTFKRKSKKVILGMLLLSCLSVLYKPILSGQYTLRGITACASNPKYMFESFVMDAIFAFSITLIPFLIITVLNALIVRALCLRNFRKNELFAAETKIRLEFTLILLAISCFFITFNLPYSTIWIRNFISSKMLQEGSTKFDPGNIEYWNGVLNITRTIFYLNYCANFFLYSITGAYFRKELAKMFHCFKRSRRTGATHIRFSVMGSISTKTTNGLGNTCATYEA